MLTSLTTVATHWRKAWLLMAIRLVFLLQFCILADVISLAKQLSLNIQMTIVISNSRISNNRLSRSENLIPA